MEATPILQILTQAFCLWLVPRVRICRYVPLLRAINKAGWEPVTHARVVGTSPVGTSGDGVFVERWGELTRVHDLYWTIRAEGRVTVHEDDAKQQNEEEAGGVPKENEAWIGSKQTLFVDAQALGIPWGNHTCEVLSNGWLLSEASAIAWVCLSLGRVHSWGGACMLYNAHVILLLAKSWMGAGRWNDCSWNDCR